MPSEKPTFQGLRVLALESRRSADMARMIERLGGQAINAPSMRETSVDDPRPAVEFAHRLLAGQIDALILLTGVGVQKFVEQAAPHVGRERLVNAMSDVPIVARGPKPTMALKALGIKPTHQAPEPNTWRELLTLLDQKMPVANMTVGLQEYGVTNPSLVAGLEARGARVDRLCVYRWELPEDTGPLEQAVRLIAEGGVDVVMFTSAQQINNLLEVADRSDLGPAVRKGMQRMVVASIGPTTSERLEEEGLPIDLEASPPKMGTLVVLAAEKSHGLITQKRGAAPSIRTPAPSATTPAPAAAGGQSLFLRACRREPTERTPVWLMRQAGRYMPEYRAVRSKLSFLELCKNPRLCSEVMCTAVDYLGVDAAIIFSDLLPILEPMGLKLEFAPGDGPVIHNPVRTAADVDRVLALQNIDALDYVVETVRQTRADLPADMPLIGFAGAPFTLASYAIEGGSSRTYLHSKTLMLRDEGAWRALLEKLADSAALYLNAQIAAGAEAVQVFDSWVGCLGPEDYRRYVLPATQRLLSQIDSSAVVIHFGAGNPALLPLLAEAGGDVIGVDWRIDLARAWEMVGPQRAVQGNLDPAVLLADPSVLRERVRSVIDQAAGRPGHVFNLGHGILQQTPPENARALVAMVKELSARG
ncbi:Uroporphyrinogen decarboxylase [Pirellulimonas nuda]|uniref:Uroporphyrinogen decarboxylase n=1 Tax=Pirellulimonas nuda TaxID=2528009 RepID=A0A518D6I1_9BACT|nr:uroporphyrinogen decarboxylase [Pirellulimonas nuda]QDU87098.1 Uroporphyrinogen decarboxylase [Pirellulimonas nuda]